MKDIALVSRNHQFPFCGRLGREIYLSCNDDSIHAQQSQLTLWSSLAI
jgi:hypothetical protein